MDKQILKDLFFHDGEYCAGKWRNADKCPEVWDLSGDSLSEKVWNGLYKRPTCFCGKLTKWVNFTVGYRAACSRKCAQRNAVIEFDKSHRMSKLWNNPEWRSQMAEKMKLAHHHSRTPKKLAKLAERGITPLDIIEPGQDAEYRWKHECGQVFTRSFARIAAIYCPVCHVSQGQGEVYEFVRTRYSGTIVVNDRHAIAPKEIDIYLPELKVGIEFNGKYWHPGDGRREAQKSTECKQTGIKLLHVWEEQWKKNRRKVEKQIERLLDRGSV